MKSFMRTYEQWILLNTDSVRHIETLLKGMLFFLPGRFKEQELTSELGAKCSLLANLYYYANPLKSQCVYNLKLRRPSPSANTHVSQPAVQASLLLKSNTRP